MQLIDRQGRVLGVINIIDLTVLLILLSTAAGFSWLAYTGELFRDFDPSKKEFIEKEVEVVIKNQTGALLPALESEMIRLKNNTLSRVNIINITSIAFKTQEVCIERVVPDRYDVTLRLKLKTNFDRYQKTYYYNNAPIKKGMQLDIKTSSENISTTVIDIIR